MKWAWISVGVTLIIAITVICCFMIYVGSYKCTCFVWALYLLLVVYLVICRFLIMKKMQADFGKKSEELQCKANEAMQNSYVTAVMKEILALQRELEEVKYISQTNIKNPEK